MSQDTIFKGDRGRNNPVRLTVFIEGGNLNDFTNISVAVGADVRMMSTSPLSIVIEDDNTLALYFYDTDETRGGHFIISGFNSFNPFGILITSVCQSNLARYKICE